MQFKLLSVVLPLLSLSAASPISINNEAAGLAVRNSPSPSPPSYTECSFVQQIGLVNLYLCNVLNGNTISIPVSVSIPLTLKKREATSPSTSPSPPSPSYTSCSFVQQIGLANVYLCNVLDGNTISIPVSVSIPLTLKKREATSPSTSPSPPPSYTECSFVQQIGLVNLYLCNVLNGNTLSIPISVSIPLTLKKREATSPSTSPSPPSPSYTSCSFVQQIGLVNVFLCDVLDGNTISIPISVSIPLPLEKREATSPSTSPSPPPPSYTSCSFVQQIGLVNLYLCNVLNGNTISVPISVSIPVTV